MYIWEKKLTQTTCVIVNVFVINNLSWSVLGCNLLCCNLYTVAVFVCLSTVTVLLSRMVQSSSDKSCASYSLQSWMSRAVSCHVWMMLLSPQHCEITVNRTVTQAEEAYFEDWHLNVKTHLTEHGCSNISLLQLNPGGFTLKYNTGYSMFMFGVFGCTWLQLFTKSKIYRPVFESVQRKCKR